MRGQGAGGVAASLKAYGRALVYACENRDGFQGSNKKAWKMNSQKIAAILATIIGLVVAVYVLAFGPVGNRDKSEKKKVERTGAPKGPVVQEPGVKGPVVRELPLPEK